jgi:5-methylcytosine-specific restriction enzyme A
MLDFSFDDQLLNYFGAEIGAGSLVTEKDEAKKAQITVTTNERPVFESVLKNIPTGSRTDLGDEALFEFRLFPDGRIVQLPLLFLKSTPQKPNRNELRLYMNANKFKPQANDFWFVFIRKGQFWLGVMTKAELAAARAGILVDLQDGVDAENELGFQIEANTSQPITFVSNSVRYRRNPLQAAASLKQRNFICELRPEQLTFQSQASGRPFMEAHHLIPMFFQKYMTDTNIDTAENICCLSPNAHRLIHYGKKDDVKAALSVLSKSRMDFLSRLDVSVSDLQSMYGV